MTTMIIKGELPQTGTVTDNYVTFDHLPIMPRIALWAGHLYQGTVTCWAGEGGSGKGITGIWVGAAVVTGGLMPGEKPDTTRDRAPRRVLGVWPEDDANEDLAPRWDAALRWHLAIRHEAELREAIAEARGTAPEEVGMKDLMAAVSQAEVDEALALVTNLTESLDDEPFTIGKAKESLNAMRSVIDCYAGPDPDGGEQIPVGLVILDPLLAITDTSLGSNPAARKVLVPLMRQAKETGVAYFLTHHTTKDGKVAGSKGVTDVLRLVYMATWDTKNDGVVIVHKDKGNNVGKVTDMRYTVEGDELRPLVVWSQPPAPRSTPPKPASTPPGSWRARYGAPASARPSRAPQAGPAPQRAAQRPSVAIWGRP